MLEHDPSELTLDDLMPDPDQVSDVVLDRQRLAEIDRLHAADVDHVQPLVEDLLHAAAQATGSALALLNVVLPATQVLAGQAGLAGWLAEARATPVEWSLCARVVRQRSPLVIGDWAADPSTSDNPLHTVDGLQAYAGVPLRSSSGAVLGALCVLDHRARDFDLQTLALLEQLADAARDRLEGAAGAV